jgi:Flp pilus assembly protein TadG
MCLRSISARPPTPGAARLAAVLRGDRGAVSVELVLATPLLLLMLLAIVQFALWSHATHIAQAAASQGKVTGSRILKRSPAGTRVLEVPDEGISTVGFEPDWRGSA